MPLLFWYLPFMIISGAYDTFHPNEVSHRQDRVADAEKRCFRQP
jgi:hypothetical protein